MMKNILFVPRAEAAADILKAGGIAVMPTDTIYGMVARALSKKAVARIYKLRHRDPKKPCIVLIHDLSDMKRLGIELRPEDLKILKRVWPGPVSVVFPCPNKKFQYLHRGTKSLALRLPAHTELRKLIKKTGPLVAPSANHEGGPPATTLAEAFNYFGTGADVYINGAVKKTRPSTLVMLENGKFRVLRQGTGKVPNELLLKQNPIANLR